jgi:D-alanyl-D-alanine carboxypeptidase
MGALLRGEVGSFVASGHGDTAGATLDATSRFRIASVTKPIVAALVLTAVDRGELTLNTVVGDVLPGYLRPTPKITVRQLLDHTSGIFDEGNEGDPVADIEKLPDPAMKAEARALLARVRAGEPIVVPERIVIALAETHDRYFAPNEGYHYSNVNYQLAAAVLASVTKNSLSDLLRERVTGPMRLEHTTLAPSDTTSPELRGYQKDAKGALVDVTDDLAWFGNGGNGGILSTPMEVAAIFRAIASAQLFPEPLVRAMEGVNGESYGLGVGRYEQPCGTFFGHGGFVNATQSIALVSPDAESVVVLTMNLADGRDPGLARLAGEVLCPAGG